MARAADLLLSAADRRMLVGEDRLTEILATVLQHIAGWRPGSVSRPVALEPEVPSRCASCTSEALFHSVCDRLPGRLRGAHATEHRDGFGDSWALTLDDNMARDLRCTVAEPASATQLTAQGQVLRAATRLKIRNLADFLRGHAEEAVLGSSPD